MDILHRYTRAVLMTVPGDTLQGADLNSADLQGANLRSADLNSANLQGANLRSADLQGANLRSADLQGANLSGANLQGANLNSANLRSANLNSANLRSATYGDKTQWPHFQIAEGALIVWKRLAGGAIAKLEVPMDAKRTATLIGRKCRAEYVRVFEITCDGAAIEECEGSHDPSLIYRVGEIVRPDSYNDDFRLECTNGIHFFQTRAEAEQY